MNCHRSTAVRNLTLAAIVCFLLGSAPPGGGPRPSAPPFNPPADSVIDLSLERMVELALHSSYRVRRLNIDVRQSRLHLEASRARLRSRVDLDFTLPRVNAISETRWYPDLQRSVISRENSRLMELDLSVRQPVILFGFPTNGYLSLTNRIYQLRQVTDTDSDLRYYTRAFVSYTQPFFQANSLKNELERASMDLEWQELGYYDDIVRIIDSVSDDYFELFELAWEERARTEFVENLEGGLAVAERAAAADAERGADVDLITIELSNARENLAATRSQLRLETSRVLTVLNLPPSTELRVEPEINLFRVPIDPDQAVEYAMALSPRMRQLGLQRRHQELQLDEVKGRGGFELDVSLSYGREMQDEVLGRIWDQPQSSYTVAVRGSLPLWDWGERSKRIQATALGVDRALLEIEETVAETDSRVRNEVRTVSEFEDRAFAMQTNLLLARSAAATSLERYTAGETSALELVQSLRRELDTADNFLDTYLGWRSALRGIQRQTFFDFEAGAFILDRFGISFADAG